MKKFKIGLTCGVFDMFHVGHLNILKNAKKQCDYLIVGVSTDELVFEKKGKLPIISLEERIEILKSIKYVDKVILQENYGVEGKVFIAKKYHANAIFVGSDWKGTKKWEEIKKELAKIGCSVVFLKHTDGISSTILREKISN